MAYGITTSGMPHVNIPGAPRSTRPEPRSSPPKGGGPNRAGKGPRAPKPARPIRVAPKSKGQKSGHAPAPQAVNPLLDPTQILSGKGLDQAAQGIADAQTVGPLSELAKQIAANNQQSAGVQKQDFGYFMSLAKAAQDSVNQSQATNAQLNSSLAGIGQSTQQQLGQLGAQAQGGVNARMQALGLGGDTQQGLQAEMARQQGIGALQSQASQQFGAQQGANNVQQAAADQGATGLAGQQDIANVALKGTQANEPLNAKIAGLQASRGALKATALGQLRTAERNYMIAQEGLSNTAANDVARNNLTAQQNAALDQLRAQGLQVSVGNNQRNNATSQANTRSRGATSRANNAANNATSSANNQRSNATAQRGQNLRAAGGATGSASKPLPRVSNLAVLGKISRIKGLIQQAKAAGHAGAQIRQSLQNGTFASGIPAYDSHLVDAAWELLGYGHLTPGTAQWMHSQGIRGGGYKVAPAPKPAKPGGVLGGIINNA